MHETAGVTLRYPSHALVPDYLKSGTGVAISLGVLATNPPSWTLGAIFGGVFVLFGGFGLRTIRQNLLRLHITDAGLRCAGLGTRRLSWANLTSVKLRYFGRRQKPNQATPPQAGFFQLTLEDATGCLRFEGTLENFDYLVWRAAKAARDAGVSLDPTTAGNMLAIEIDPDGETEPPIAVRQLAAQVDGD